MITFMVAGIETYFLSEYSQTHNDRLYKLIDQAMIADELKSDIHKLRKYRNIWVHVDDPWDDESLLDSSEDYERELEEMAFAVR